MREEIRRFADAQDKPVQMERTRGRTWFEVAREELERGAKVSHWIWWTFPQFLPNVPLEELSFNSQTYAINDTREAVTYLETPLLCNRYHGLTRVVLGHSSRRVPPLVLMGGKIDCRKLSSSLTLFSAVALWTSRLELTRDATSVLVHMEAAGFCICQHTLQCLDFHSLDRGE
jgi:uncharacterized protein (DUF1810 family)